MTTTSPSARCLITGASRGIGASIVSDLAGQGYRLALTARGSAGLHKVASELPEGIEPPLVLPADATDPTSADWLKDHIDAAWGGLDVLVINAGEGRAAPLARTDDAMWASSIELNLTAPFRLMRAFVPAMAERGYGRVVVVASVAAKVGTPYISAYAAAKHGVLGLVRSVAAEVATRGVTVNAVCPGFVDTPMTEQSIEAIMESTGRTYEQARATLEKQQPINRLISTEEVARAVSFCIADSGALNGQAITLDGGGVQS